MSPRDTISASRTTSGGLCLRLALVALVAANGITTSLTWGQVRQMVLEDPSRPTPPSPPPLLPPRVAEFALAWERDLPGDILDGLLGGPGGVVFSVKEGSLGLVAPDGTLSWTAKVADQLAFAPSGMNGRLLVAAPKELSAWSARTGERLWRTRLTAPPLGSPAIGPQRVLVAVAPDALTAVALETGEPLWTRSLGCTPSGSPAIFNDRVVAGCRDGRVVALDASDGHRLWERALGAGISGQPIVVGNMVYAANDDRRVAAINPVKGRVRYRARVGGRPGILLSRADLLFVGTYDNHLYAVRLDRGHLAWAANIGSRVTSPPAVRGHVVVSSSALADELVAVDLRDGAVLAREPVPGDQRLTAAGPVFIGNRLITASRPTAGGPGKLSALDVTTRLADTNPAGGPPTARR